jgi:HEPN domain-containing protein
MDEPTLEYVRMWLKKASNDLAAARKLSADPDPFLDAASYHCQQAAEKALKGFLTAKAIRFPKTHDLAKLLDLIAPATLDFEMLRPHAIRLTPYAEKFRYPGEYIEPSREEFDQALADAEAIFNRVVESLPPEAAV